VKNVSFIFYVFSYSSNVSHRTGVGKLQPEGHQASNERNLGRSGLTVMDNQPIVEKGRSLGGSGLTVRLKLQPIAGEMGGV
jgi:hypothetical protein